MIVRNVGGIIKIIDVICGQEDAFLEKNPTGGFLKVDVLPYARYGNYKMVNNEIVVDEEAENIEFSNQYQRDRQYPQIQEQLDMLYWDKKNGTSNWEEAIDTIKAEFPKP